MKCTPIVVEDFEEFKIEMRELGSGGFGEVGLVPINDRYLQRILTTAGYWTGEKKDSRFAAVKIFQDLTYDHYKEGDKRAYAKLRSTVNAEAELIDVTHKRVPHLTPKLIGCVELLKREPDSSLQTVRFVIFMTYAGRSLSEVGNRLSYEALRERLIQGVSTLHMNGIVHNDIKPANLSVLIHKKNGQLKLTFIDMGGVCLLEESRKEDEAVRCPKFINTRGYHHPEIAELLYRKSRDGTARDYACLSSIHDWFGVVGTLYMVLHLHGAVRAYDSAEGGFAGRLAFFKDVFESDPFILQILNLPVRKFLNGEIRVEDLCMEIREIDEMGFGRDEPSPDTVRYF